MKTIYKTLMMAAWVLLAMTALTSCDRDYEEAYVLSGEWTGNFGMFYDDGYNIYYADYTDIRFIPNYDYSTRGYGEEIDYFRWPCPIRYQSFYFYWEIRHGVIYLSFPYNHGLDVAIRDYRLSYDYFEGYFGDTNDHFRLVKLTGYYDWNLYDPYNYYGYGYYDYYYTKGRDGATTGERIESGAPESFTFGRSLNRNQAEE